MDRVVDEFVVYFAGLSSTLLRSADRHALDGWNSFRSLRYPEFDLNVPSPIGEFDVLLCEQVLEHVVDPQLAAKTLASLCIAGGHVIVTTPFMLRIHPSLLDLWRRTPDGMTQLLREAGLKVLNEPAPSFSLEH